MKVTADIAVSTDNVRRARVCVLLQLLLALLLVQLVVVVLCSQTTEADGVCPASQSCELQLSPAS